MLVAGRVSAYDVQRETKWPRLIIRIKGGIIGSALAALLGYVAAIKWVSIVQEHTPKQSQRAISLLVSLIRLFVCRTRRTFHKLTNEWISGNTLHFHGLCASYDSRHHTNYMQNILATEKPQDTFFSGMLKPPVHLSALSHDPIDNLEFSLQPQFHPLFPGFIPLQSLKPLSRFVLRVL